MMHLASFWNLSYIFSGIKLGLKKYSMKQFSLIYTTAVIFYAGIFFICGVSVNYGMTMERVLPSDLFTAGQHSFKAGNHEEALSYFLKARNAGMNKPSLYYNLGVCHYSLGQYSEATEAFRQIISNPEMAPLAYYNLGLISLKDSDNRRASYWFKKAYDTTSNDKLRILASAALDKVGEKVSDSWSRYLSFALGYDDNVELTIDSETLQASNKGDFFSEIYGVAIKPVFGGTSSEGPLFTMGGSYLKYFDLNEFDSGSINTGLFYRNTLNGIRLKSGVDYAYTLIDGSSFEQIPSASIQGKYSLNPSVLFRFRYRLSYLDILDSDFDYLEGWRHRGLAESRWKWKRLYSTLSYILELNGRDNDDFSPTRHTVRVAFDLDLNHSWDMHLQMSYRKSTYDIDGMSDRDEDRFIGKGRLVYFLEKGWEIRGEYQHTDNDSNYDTYDYTRN
ncbi:MAG: tetratricopeptide repeat protein, partial [Desulforhopalus sp.]|nr:tetratricopeptide repeat protein [Desulforhopalus sp.]